MVRYIRTPGGEKNKNSGKKWTKEELKFVLKLYLLLKEDADDNQLIQNILEHPILLERPIIKYKNKAVIGRPPENVLKLIN